MSDYEIINDRILKNGIRKEYLANRLNLSQNYFYMVLNGRKKLNTNRIDRLNNILDLYEVARNKIIYVI